MRVTTLVLILAGFAAGLLVGAVAPLSQAGAGLVQVLQAEPVGQPAKPAVEALAAPGEANLVPADFTWESADKPGLVNTLCTPEALPVPASSTVKQL